VFRDGELSIRSLPQKWAVKEYFLGNASVLLAALIFCQQLLLFPEAFSACIRSSLIAESATNSQLHRQIDLGKAHIWQLLDMKHLDAKYKFCHERQSGFH